MKKILFIALFFIFFTAKSADFTFYSSINSEILFYNAIIPADSAIFMGMAKSNNHLSLYWIKNNVSTELKTLSTRSLFASTVQDEVGSYKQWFSNGNNALFVVNETSPDKRTLWITDGTSGGTDSIFSTTNYQTKFFMGGMIGKDFYFTVTTQTPYATLLYKTDFTKSGTVLVQTINNTNLFWPYVDNQTLYLDGYVKRSATYAVLYKYTSDTTNLLMGYGYATSRVINGDLYYGGLYKKNLTTSVITNLTNTFSFTLNEILGLFNGKIYLTGTNISTGTAPTIFTCDANAGSLQQLTKNTSLYKIPTLYFSFKTGKNLAYFIGQNSLAKYGLYVTDGTDAGTHQIQNFNNQSSATPTLLTCDDRLYFNSYIYPSGTTNNSAWAISTCDSSSGSLQTINWGISPNTSIERMVKFQDKIVFIGYDPSDSYNNKLYAFNTCIDVPSGTTGINSIGENDIEIYPNPSNGLININISNPPTKTSVLVYNLLGEMVFQSQNIVQSNTLNLALNSGIYFITIVSDHSKSTQKIIVQ